MIAYRFLGITGDLEPVGRQSDGGNGSDYCSGRDERWAEVDAGSRLLAASRWLLAPCLRQSGRGGTERVHVGEVEEGFASRQGSSGGRKNV